MNYIIKLIRRAANLAGFDIHRLYRSPDRSSSLMAGIEWAGVDLVLDVGANSGQFASKLRSLGYAGRMVSFEPLSIAHRELENAAGRDPLWTVHDRCAIGALDGEAVINIAGNYLSSSILPMLESHLSAAPGSVYVGVEKVPVYRLDTAAPPYLEKSRKPLLKIDTQGYEWHVLDGAAEILPRITGVLCELSLIPLYEGQHLWLDVIKRLEAEGFTLWAIFGGFTDKRYGRTLQVDALFLRL